MSDAEIDKLKDQFDEKHTEGYEEELLKELEENKEHLKIRKEDAQITNYNNIIFIYGCQAGAGLSNSSKLVTDIIQLYSKNFDPE